MKEDNSQKKHNIIELLNSGHSVELSPEGYSMYPLIVPNRDRMVISPINNHHIKRGDVLLYRFKDGRLFVHRVFKRINNELIMVGDNQHILESPTPIENVYGIMTSFTHKNKTYKSSNPFYVLSYKIWLILFPFRKQISIFIHKIKPKA